MCVILDSNTKIFTIYMEISCAVVLTCFFFLDLQLPELSVNNIYWHRNNEAINQNVFSFILLSEVSRNDSCPDLPEIQNGWKTTSHVALVRGACITYQCDPGYDLVGRETLTCQLDLSWSSQPPFCEKSEFCLFYLFVH